MSQIDLTRKTVLFPKTVDGLIQYLQENRNDIESYIVCIVTKDSEEFKIAYDVNTYLEATGMLAIAMNTIHTLSYEEIFKSRR